MKRQQDGGQQWPNVMMITTQWKENESNSVEINWTAMSTIIKNKQNNKKIGNKDHIYNYQQKKIVLASLSNGTHWIDDLLVTNGID